MAETVTAPAPARTAAQLRAEYDALAAECAKLAADIPKQRKAFEDKLRKDIMLGMKDFEKRFAAKKAAKHSAYVAWEAAVAAESK